MVPIVYFSFSKATEKKCYWAARVFETWKHERNIKAVSQPQLNISPIQPGLLEMSNDELCYSLSRFCMEAKKQNGENYPSETLYELIISIQLYLEMSGNEVKLLNDEIFQTLKNTLDNRMKQLSASGIKTPRKQADIISEEEEEALWSKCILGSDTPVKLADTLLYMLGLHFALRAGNEHRNLRFVNSQLSLNTDKQGNRFLRYIEDTSKNMQGGLRHRKVTPKQVDAYENKVQPSRCIVKIYEEYISHRPDAENAIKNPAFYLRPLSKPKSSIWFANQARGENELAKVVSRICNQGGLLGFRTNHSLRSTAASRLYNKGFDEQLIMETTGHRSNAVRGYKRTSDDQKKSISDALCVNLVNDEKVVSNHSEKSVNVDGFNISLTLNINK